MQGTMPGARRRGRQRTAWMDNIKMWTGLSVEESIRMTEDRNKWRKYVHDVATGQPSDRGRLKNKTKQIINLNLVFFNPLMPLMNVATQPIFVGFIHSTDFRHASG